MDSRLRLREHEPAQLPEQPAARVIEAVTKLKGVLQPRLAQVARVDAGIEVRNFVGSVRLNDGTILDVEPKVPATQAWAEAVVQLLKDSSRISVTGSQRSSIGNDRSDLTSVIAFEYARRLERALSKDGPIEVFERQKHASRRLDGQLDVGTFVLNAWRDPAMFPVRRDQLTAANDFAHGLSLVSRSFRRSVSDLALSARLRRLESSVLPGQALPSYVDPAVAFRNLPPQWSSYRPAWDIAAAVLRNRSVINDPGHSLGLEVAVEPWPLLETLLERTLDALARDSHMALRSTAQEEHTVLTFHKKDVGSVKPDGVLRSSTGDVLATFEAKYTRPPPHPKDEHRYQALAAAAVLGSPVAVIVYPGDQAPRVYDVQGFSGRPAKLATIGLDMYQYTKVGGAELRASWIADVLMTVGALERGTPSRKSLA